MTAEALGFACARRLAALAAADPSIRVLDADLADSNGAIAFARAHPDRFVQVGIAEQALVAIAAGLAAEGLRPWVFSFAAFLCFRAYDQIRVAVCQTGLPVRLVGSHAGACLGRNGKSHVALNDIAVMSTLPGIEVWAPADAADVAACVDALQARAAPAYVRLPRAPQPPLPARPASELGWLGPPTPVAMASCGLATQWAVQAAALLRAHGLDCGILHLNRVWPIDPDRLAQMLAGVETLVVVDDHVIGAGLAGCLMAADATVPIRNWGWPRGWAGQSGSEAELLSALELDPPRLAQFIAALAGR